MGNQNSATQHTPSVRYRTIDSRRNIRREQTNQNYSIEVESRRGSSNATPLYGSSNDRSFQIRNSFDNEEHSVTLQPITKKQQKVQNRFLPEDFSNYQGSIRETPIKGKRNNNQTLQTLSKQNQILRLQLKKINDELTSQLKKKKLVPKKIKQEHEDDPTDLQKKYMGLKRQLENGYKQIQMYKRTISNLKGREESDTSEYRLRMLENKVSDLDKEIQKYMKRIQGVNKVKRKQDRQIQQDINDDLKEGVQTYKHQSQMLKKRLKELAARDRQRQTNYKKQQAYQIDLQRKMREISGNYFPQLKEGISYRGKQYQKTAASQKQRVNPKQFRVVSDQAKLLRSKHQQYYKRIDLLLMSKNRAIEDQNWMREQITYKERIIQALRNKLSGFKNLTKPRKNGLFGYTQGETDNNLSDYNDTPSQIERQIMEQLNQDQFDIKHLIANIPKPVRKRPEELSNGYSSDSSGDAQKMKGKGMVVTNEKASPKKWGAVSTRTQQRGKHFKGQLSFEDRGHFRDDVQPLIVGINVWIDKNNLILAIQGIYLQKGEIRYGAKSAETKDAITRRFDLQNPDYLKNLSMTIGQQGFVESFTFYSKEGKVGKFGNKRSADENVNFGLASNQRPFLLLGASSLYESQPRINRFGLQICQQ